MALPARYRLTEGTDYRITEAGDRRLLEAAYDPYLGYDLLPFRTNWADPPSERIDRSMTTLVNTTGLPVVITHVDSPIASFEMALTLEGRNEIWGLLGYLRQLKGRHQPIWVPTWQSDMKPTVDFSGSSMTIESIGYEDNLYPFTHRRHVAVIRHDGTIYPRRVTGASDNGTTETISLNASIGATIYAEACLVSFLLYCRLSDDSVQIRWLGRDLALITLVWVELPRETPVS